MKIIVENSTWNNLGDGFYQFALFELIKRTFPEADVFYGEGPVERAFKPKGKQLDYALKLNEHEKADIHVISGPMLGTLTLSDYKQMIINIVESGSRYAILTTSCMGLDGKRLEDAKEFLKKYPPIAFSSRDPETYDKFKDVLPSAYNGVCTAFLVDKLLPIDTLDIGKKYFVSSFYRNPEPTFISDVQSPNIEDIKIKPNKGYLPFTSWRINRHFEIYQNRPASVGGVEIVRTVQQVSTKSNNFNFKYPNSFITWSPINLLSAFKGASFTISERVHACATTLAFGKPARIMIEDPRNGIYTRFGIDYKKHDGIMYPDGLDERIDLEMKALQDYMKHTFKV